MSFVRQSIDQSSIATSLYNDRIGDKIKCLDEDESVNSDESFMSCPSPSHASLDLTPRAEYISRDLINKNGRKLPSPFSSSGHRKDSLYQDGPLRIVSKDPMVRDSNNGMAVLVPGMVLDQLIF